MRIPSSSRPAPSIGTIPLTDTVPIVMITVNYSTTVAVPDLESSITDTESVYLVVNLSN